MSSNFYKMRAGNYHSGLIDLINYLEEHSKNMDMIEIGSYLGESTILFAQKFNKIISIDPFLDNYDMEDEVCKDNYANFDLVYEEFKKNTKDYKNITHIRKLSDDAVNDITEKVDFVYIDGLHQYEQVKKDIINYMPFVKSGGFIGGHDYLGSWVGVKAAVDELIGKPDLVFQDSSWLKRL